MKKESYKREDEKIKYSVQSPGQCWGKDGEHKIHKKSRLGAGAVV